MHVQKLKLQKNCSLGYLQVVCDGKQKLQAEKEVCFCHQQKDRQKKKKWSQIYNKIRHRPFSVTAMCPGDLSWYEMSSLMREEAQDGGSGGKNVPWRPENTAQ